MLCFDLFGSNTGPCVRELIFESTHMYVCTCDNLGMENNL
jgi:hypothetical protein